MDCCQTYRPEVRLDCVLADPMIQLVMRSDGVSELDLREAMESARDRLREGIVEPH
jgi:hypothetical protein